MSRKADLYRRLEEQADWLLGDERDFGANAANFASLLWHSLPHVAWAGFYLHRRGELVLGPFQGKPACVRIQMGRGVCGASAKTRRTIVVPDVRRFAGHIACDPASRSEMVVPLLKGRRLVGVLDLDSPVLRRFDSEDRAGVERLARLFLARTSGP